MTPCLCGESTAVCSIERRPLPHPHPGERLIDILKDLARPGLALLVCLLAALPARAGQAGDFTAWLAALRQEALSRGVSAAVLDAALGDIQPLPKILELDQRQPEHQDTFLDYLERRVTPERVEQGRKLLHQHRKLLTRLSRRYHIPPSLLVAFWGLETQYGQDLGNYPVPAALATLAFDTRREGFFRAQLLAALDILQAGHVAPAQMTGSWAGAMGQMQFMPSTFQDYAVDADGDGRKDLWRSLPDAFASAAHYLHRLGWRERERWGREVRLPPRFDWRLAHPDTRKSATAWRALGVRQADGKPLPRSALQGAIVLPQGHAGPAFLVYRNFSAILDWNRAVNYALAVGHLSDRLLWGRPLRTGAGADQRGLSRDELLELQRLLSQRGFEPGAVDGVPGAQTKTAIRRFQGQAGLPADGYPSLVLLERLRGEAGSPPAGRPDRPSP